MKKKYISFLLEANAVDPAYFWQAGDVPYVLLLRTKGRADIERSADDRGGMLITGRVRKVVLNAIDLNAHRN